VVNVGAYIMASGGHRDYFKEREVVIFQVIDSAAGDSARGDWDGHWCGVVRPLLTWTTDFTTASASMV
jgi:hypothetical protein